MMRALSSYRGRFKSKPVYFTNTETVSLLQNLPTAFLDDTVSSDLETLRPEGVAIHDCKFDQVRCNQSDIVGNTVILQVRAASEKVANRHLEL